jgi:UDP:flavonoid glycosyltransferase YjiC (YdhE family)
LLSGFIKALEKSNSRGVIIMADIEEDDELLDNNSVILAREVPYSWLLNHVSLVVHHFGFGTTAETLRAGIPSVPIPHIMDQQQRAKQISRMGFATKPINIKGEFSGHLAKAIKEANDDKAMKDACIALAEKIQLENGNKVAAAKILAYLATTV